MNEIRWIAPIVVGKLQEKKQTLDAVGRRNLLEWIDRNQIVEYGRKLDKLKCRIHNIVDKYRCVAAGGWLGCTGFFRSSIITNAKIKDARYLIDNIWSCFSMEHMEKLLLQSVKNNDDLQERMKKASCCFTGGSSRYLKCLRDCLDLVREAMKPETLYSDMDESMQSFLMNAY